MNIDNGQIVIFAVVGLLIAITLLSAYRRREAIGRNLRHRFLMAGSFLLALLIAKQFTQDPWKAFLVAVIVELIVGIRTRPVSRRYISRIEKRKAIARFERSGKRYDPRLHEIDHIIPYSRGGGSRADNLRVIERDRNRQKSARAPWWDVFSR